MQESNKRLGTQKKVQKEAKEHKMEKQSKKDVNDKEDKIDSVFIAQELIFGDEVNIDKWLAQFKEIKNHNYDKFTDRIFGNLQKGTFSFHAALDRFILISNKANEQNTTGHQMASILAAFGRFWVDLTLSQRDSQIVEDDMEIMFGFIDKVYSHIGKKYIAIVRQIIEQRFTSQFDYYAKQALNLVNKLLKANRIDENKILALTYQFDLYGEVAFGKIVDLVLRQTNINDSIYVFLTRQGQIRMNLVKTLVDRCTHNDIKSDFSKCQTALRSLKVDPFQYPQYITKMQQRYICYLMRSFKLYYIQLIISHDRKLISLLVEQLERKGRHKESNYFIHMYKLQKQFDVHFSQEEAQRISKMRNILLDNDQFGPTEVDVLEDIQDQQMEKKYLHLNEFGVREKDVVFIDSKNIGHLNYKQEFQDKIGIDEERAGGTHVFDPPVTSILQIYNGKKVFIFDYLQLGDHKAFKEIMSHIFEVCHIYGQDLQKQLTAMHQELNLDVTEKVLQELAANRVHDSSKMFKKVFPKETKSSLAYLCERIFNKTLSKYEQCSGWVRRPLRKAQLHYAALDCVLPYKICQQLAKMEKGQ